MKKLILVLQIVFISILLSTSLLAQDTVTKAEKKFVIDTICQLLRAEYINVENTEFLCDTLLYRLENGIYDKANTESGFANLVANDLYFIGNDKHLYFYHDPEEVQLIQHLESKNKSEKMLAHEELAEKDRTINYGFNKLERLKGNVGYLELLGFKNPRYAAETAIASMQFLSSCDAVIIDLRKNHGGFSAMVCMLSSYFFEDETLLRTMHYKSGKIHQGWTLPYVPGSKLYDKDLYILISGETGSAAEAFSYFMKSNKRATLVGETTKGAAHNIRDAIILDKYIFHLPDKKPIDPNTGGNWELVGVKPHVEVKQDKAYDKAYQLAIEKLIAKNPEHEFYELDWAYSTFKAKETPLTISDVDVKKYTGKFDNRTISTKNGKLFYQRDGSNIFEIEPLTKEMFKLKNVQNLRLKFCFKNGEVEKLVVLYDDGFKLVKPKNKS